MNYRENLLRVIDGWNSAPIADEWLFEKFRENVVGFMSPSSAFDAINETIDILLHEPDESTATEILQTLIGLARQSETTEVPSMLLTNKVEIEAKFAFAGDYAKSKLQELFRHYRM